MKTPSLAKILTSLGVSLVMATVFAISAEAKATSNGKKTPTPRDVEVDTVKDQYWNRTAEGDVEVVQNRLYSKKGRLSLQGMVGTASSDPFLSIKSLNGGLSYHLSETFALTGIYRKFLVSNSSYYDELHTGLITGTPSTANTNEPSAFYGGEIEWSPLYGKISLSGSSIVHYDAHLLFGAGITDTETGKDFTPTVGLGAQFYLSNTLALRMDYRLGIFKENIPQKNPVLTSGVVGSRTNYMHQFGLGLELFL